MEYYRIGEFAKRCGTTVEFLKYYDREGLICPLWRDEAGYRYYADYQMVHFAEFYNLSRMGFSSKEVKHIHNACSLAEVESRFLARRDGLLSEIAEHQQALTYLDSLLTAVRHIRQRDSWYIQYVPDAVFSRQNLVHTAQHNEPWWKAGFHLSQIWQRVELAPSNGTFPEINPLSRRWGMLVSEQDPASKDPLNSNINVPGGRCFLYWHSVPAQYDEPSHRLSDEVWNLSEPLSIMAQHNLTPRGDLYQRRLFVTQEEAGTVVHILTQIPLK